MSERPWSEQTTPNGHLAAEASSAMQKCLRRGMEREALYWMSELDRGGWPAYVFRRLAVVCSEDVGLASTETLLALRALHSNWLDARKAKAQPLTASLFLVHATILLARSRKSRLVDDALVVTYQGERKPLEMPAWARDVHTAAGRRAGKGLADFYAEGAQLVNEADDVPNPYRDEAEMTLTTP